MQISAMDTATSSTVIDSVWTLVGSRSLEDGLGCVQRSSWRDQVGALSRVI